MSYAWVLIIILICAAHKASNDELSYEGIKGFQQMQNISESLTRDEAAESYSFNFTRPEQLHIRMLAKQLYNKRNPKNSCMNRILIVLLTIYFCYLAYILP